MRALDKTMLTRLLSLVALIVMIVLLVLALPAYVGSFAGDAPVASVVMSGLIVVVMLAGAAMLLLFGVIGIKGPGDKKVQ
jgi:hypothetical protein